MFPCGRRGKSRIRTAIPSRRKWWWTALLCDVLQAGEKLKAGDKVYAVNMKKSIVLFQIGEDPLEKGLAILGAHIDTCRLDVKQNPLYEDGGLAYLDTHYYGGIKKYQWVTLPLALHGVVVKKDGTVVEIRIGEDFWGRRRGLISCLMDILKKVG